jgi:hypothetical protein
LKRVLILTYYWPPGSGPGVQRWLKFCKFLPEFGWQPTVITVEKGSYPNIDESLLDDIPDELEVIKTKTFEPFALYNLLRGKKGNSVEVGMGSIKGDTSLLSKIANYVRANLFIPDARLGWNRYSYSAAIRSIRKNRPDLIITTGPPHSTHLVGEQLKADFNIPWIADFRDPWTTIYYNSFLNRTEGSKQKDKAFEDRVLSKADHIITATPGMQAEFESRAKSISCIANGYDESDFSTETREQHSEKFILSYVGNLKSNQNVESLWKAIWELNKDENFSAKFELNLTGNVDNTVLKSIENAGIKHLVNLEPFVAHQEAIERMRRSHLLLLPIPKTQDSKVILTGKIFEYLASDRPILAIGPTDGNAAEILTCTGKNSMIAYENSVQMIDQLRHYFQLFLNDSKPQTIGNGKHTDYSRKGLTHTLANTLNAIAAS